MKKIVFATGNKDKMREIREIMADCEVEIFSMKEAGIDVDIVENGTTFEENALIKAKAIAEHTDAIVLADDSGLEVDALNKEPGIYSARYGFDESLDDAGRVQLLLKNMKDVPDDKRQAKFVCVITLVTPDGKSIQARGEVHGFVTHAPAGEGGFCYDPIFYYPPFGKTLAQVPQEEKNRVSHRAEALKIFYTKLKEAGYAEQ